MLRPTLVFLLGVALIAMGSGCATLRNTKIPGSFNEVGYCTGCKQVMALDGIADDAICACPSCSQTVRVKDAKYNFKRSYVDRKNQQVATGVFTVTMLAASVVGAFYGVPIPPPPVDAETFKPYELPKVIECPQATPAVTEIRVAPETPAPVAIPLPAAEPGARSAETSVSVSPPVETRAPSENAVP